jgi:hemophore-related protein
MVGRCTKMVTLVAIRLAIGVGGLALSLTAGAGVALADPLDAAINTTCSYSQAVAALNAQSPAVAQQFNASPAAQAWMRTFFASPVDQRQQMARQAQSVPGAQQYVGLVLEIANTCNNF